LPFVDRQDALTKYLKYKHNRIEYFRGRKAVKLVPLLATYGASGSGKSRLLDEIKKFETRYNNDRATSKIAPRKLEQFEEDSKHIIDWRHTIAIPLGFGAVHGQISNVPRKHKGKFEAMISWNLICFIIKQATGIKHKTWDMVDNMRQNVTNFDDLTLQDAIRAIFHLEEFKEREKAPLLILIDELVTLDTVWENEHKDLSDKLKEQEEKKKNERNTGKEEKEAR